MHQKLDGLSQGHAPLTNVIAGLKYVELVTVKNDSVANFSMLKVV